MGFPRFPQHIVVKEFNTRYSQWIVAYSYSLMHFARAVNTQGVYFDIGPTEPFEVCYRN